MAQKDRAVLLTMADAWDERAAEADRRAPSLKDGYDRNPHPED